jgi:hypothetical protein
MAIGQRAHQGGRIVNRTFLALAISIAAAAGVSPAAAQTTPECKGDFNLDHMVTVDELIAAVHSALRGCGPSLEQACLDSGGPPRPTFPTPAGSARAAARQRRAARSNSAIAAKALASTATTTPASPAPPVDRGSASISSIGVPLYLRLADRSTSCL